MPTSASAELTRLVQSIQKERQDHAAAIAEIDAAFASLGITPKSIAPVQPPAAKPTRKRRSKVKNGMTGEQFLLSLLTKSKLSTAEINGMWAASGRKGSANNLLGLLTKAGTIKRADNKGGRGSVYSAA